MFAATILAITGLASAGGNLFWGILSDRIGRELSYTLACGCAFLSILVLFAARGTSDPWLLYGHGVLFGLGYATASVWQGRSGVNYFFLPATIKIPGSALPLKASAYPMQVNRREPVGRPEVDLPAGFPPPFRSFLCV